MADKKYTLQDFIQDEMRRRDLTIRGFAELIDVSHTTISRLMDPRKPTRPSLEVLVKMSEATKRSLGSLVELAYPEVAEETRPEASTIIMAQHFEELPDDLKSAILLILRNGR